MQKQGHLTELVQGPEQNFTRITLWHLNADTPKDTPEAYQGNFFVSIIINKYLY